VPSSKAPLIDEQQIVSRHRILHCYALHGKQHILLRRHQAGKRGRRTVVKHFKKIIQRAEISDDARFHDLRHSFAVTSLYAGDDIKTVQTNLGHATAQFTLDTYGHVTQKMRQDSANRMQHFYEQLSK
jgi:integrase